MKIVIQRCKREEYIKAWNYMYKNNKEWFNSDLYDGVNPSLNKKPLGTEISNFCIVAYDSEIDCKADGFEYGLPMGIFSFVVTPRQIIGKQYVVGGEKYLGKGIGRAILLENEKNLLDNGFDKYYIGCSHCSAGIYRKHFNIEPYSSDEEHDLYKFNIDLKRDNFEELYRKNIIENDLIISVIDENGEKIIDKNDKVEVKSDYKPKNKKYLKKKKKEKIEAKKKNKK